MSAEKALDKTMNNFWKQLPKPFTVLAPMDDVTDVVFREVIADAARPDVFFTEFTNVEALCSAGREAQIRRLKYTENQRPVVAQIWGIKPENYKTVAQLCKELGFDGIDINMGCPDKSACKRGACAGMINNPELARAVIEATLEGADGVPVSVKTRIGFTRRQTESWIPFLLQFPLAALTLHGRTAAELSKVPAHWDEIAKAVELRNQLRPETIFIGNGDVQSMSEVLQKHRSYGVDGVMIGRGIFLDPWVFAKPDQRPPDTPFNRLSLLKTHLDLWEKTWTGSKQFSPMRKFVKMYVHGWPNSADLRAKLMECPDPACLRAMIEEAIRSPEHGNQTDHL